jgi:hypothetical protein
MTPDHDAEIAKQTYAGSTKLSAAANSVHISLAGLGEIIDDGK